MVHTRGDTRGVRGGVGREVKGFKEESTLTTTSHKWGTN